MIVLQITELLHGHKKAVRLVRAGQRVRVQSRGRNLFDLVPAVEARSGGGMDVAKLDRALAALAYKSHKARKTNLVAAMRQERQI